MYEKEKGNRNKKYKKIILEDGWKTIRKLLLEMESLSNTQIKTGHCLFQKLLNYNINGKLYDCLTKLYTNDAACIKIGDTLTEPFVTNQGVKQGCILSPILFNIFLSDLMSINWWYQINIFFCQCYIKICTSWNWTVAIMFTCKPL